MPTATKHEIKDLAERAEPRPERRGANQDDHRLDRERHRRERQREAQLRRRGREHGYEQHRQHLHAGPDVGRGRAHADLIENR